MQFPWESRKLAGTRERTAPAKSGIRDVFPPGKSSFFGSVRSAATDLLRDWSNNRKSYVVKRFSGVVTHDDSAGWNDISVIELLRDLPKNRSESDPQGGRTNLHGFFKEVIPGVLPAAVVMPPGEGSFPGSLRDVLDLPMRRKLEGLPGASFDIQIYDMWMKAWNTLREQKNAKFCVDSNSDDECHIPEEKMLPKEDQQLAFCRNDPQLQAKGANVKSWACVNF
ncbi:unnamed protein product [Urochloa humidicola]